MPDNIEIAFLKHGFERFTVKAVRPFHGIFVADEIFGADAYQLHLWRCEGATVAQYHFKQFGAWLKVHLFATIKDQLAFHFGKLGCQQRILQCPLLRAAYQLCFVGLHFLRENPLLCHDALSAAYDKAENRSS